MTLPSSCYVDVKVEPRLLDAIEALGDEQAWFYRQLSGVALSCGEVYTGGVMAQSEIEGTLRVIQLAQGSELDELGRAVECERRGSPDDIFRVGIEYPLRRQLLSGAYLEKLVDAARQIYSGWLDVGDRRAALVDAAQGEQLEVTIHWSRSAVEDLARSIMERVEARVRAQMDELYARINRLENIITTMQSREPAGLAFGAMQGWGAGKFDAMREEFERLIGRTHRPGQVHDSVASHAALGGGGGGCGGRIIYRDVQHQDEDTKPVIPEAALEAGATRRVAEAALMRDAEVKALPPAPSADCGLCKGTGRVAGVFMADGWPCECVKGAG